MGYGCWNASGLDPDSDPKTFNLDFTWTSHDELIAGQAAGEIDKEYSYEAFSQDESDEEYSHWRSAIKEAARYLKDQGFLGVRTPDAPYVGGVYVPFAKPYAYYGDRYQNLQVAFALDKVGVYWQQEPFMGSAMCLVIAPLYHLEEEHDVWTLSDTEFRRTHGVPMDLYRVRAQRQSEAMVSFMISWLEDYAGAVSSKTISTGSGYLRNYGRFAEQLLALPLATWNLAKKTLDVNERSHLKPAVTSVVCRPPAVAALGSF